MSGTAQTQWDLEFGFRRQIDLKRDDPEPFPNKTVIGHGGCGTVYEVALGSVTVALKATYTRKLTADTLREIDVLHHVSKDRHQHVVALIGSYLYTEKRRGQFDIGIVIWPVARCDLRNFLAELEVLARYDNGTPLFQNHNEELTSAIHTVSAIVHTEEMTQVPQLHQQAVQRLSSCFGCIANAVLWLHETAHVRHRDLKPAQILLSRKGLWLTDFGMSTLITDPDNTTTNGAERMTMRYKAPERQQRLPRGRAEDIFALGCIYLEMSYVLLDRSVSDIHIHNRVEEWSYEGNVIDNLETWLKPLAGTSYSTQTSNLSGLLRGMLSYDSERRPTISSIVSYLAGGSKSLYKFFGSCCLAVTSKSVQDPTAEPQAHQDLDASHGMPTWYRTPYSPGSYADRSAEMLSSSATQQRNFASALHPGQDTHEAFSELRFYPTEDFASQAIMAPNSEFDLSRSTGGKSSDSLTLQDRNAGSLLQTVGRSRSYALERSSLSHMHTPYQNGFAKHGPTASRRGSVLSTDDDGTSEEETVVTVPAGRITRQTRHRHSQDRSPYPCKVEGCSAVFSRRDALVKHDRTHHYFTLLEKMVLVMEVVKLSYQCLSKAGLMNNTQPSRLLQ